MRTFMQGAQDNNFSMKKGRIIGIVIVAIVILYLIYRLWKGRSAAVSYTLEEVHETGDGSTTWVCMVKEDDNGNKLRPASNAFSVGDKFELYDTTINLNGIYEIKEVWIDTDGNIGCFKVLTPSQYQFNYQYSQGGDPRDGTYFGIGKIKKI